MAWDLTPRTIKGQFIQLEPVTSLVHEELCECLLNEPNGWFSRTFNINTPEAIAKIIDGAKITNELRKSLSFITRDLKTGKVAGISHFMRIEERFKQLEIGGTQVGKAFRRTHVNTETKYLMLRDAFERLGAVRVFFKADVENSTSLKAIERIGAKLEGHLRNDYVRPTDGKVCDQKIFSIIDSDWPAVKASLEQLLKRNSN
jgi:RimJ/RimL family protein N-acetyltransferase